MPCVWVKPSATSLALYQSIDPSALYFIEKTHLHPTIFFNVFRTGPVIEPEKVTGSQFIGRTDGQTAIKSVTS